MAGKQAADNAYKDVETNDGMARCLMSPLL